MTPPADIAPAADSGTADTTVTGTVDGLNGADLVGWAIDPEKAAPCEITALDAAGVVLARALADRPRADLAAYGFGRGDFAFRLRLGSLPAGGVHVLADGAELPGSPLPTGPGIWDGAVAVNDGTAEGWVVERAKPGPPPHVVLFDQDDVFLGEGEAFAAAAEDAANPYPPRHFRIPLDHAAWRRQELAVRATICGTVFARTQTRLSLLGCLDVFDERHCVGWLHCPEAPSVRLPVAAYRDGVLLATGTAGNRRDDVGLLHPGAECSGFKLNFATADVRPGVPALFSLRIAGTEVDLLGGPYLAGTRGGFGAPARALAAKARGLGLPLAELAVLEAAVGAYLASCRADPVEEISLPVSPEACMSAVRMSVVIPIYRDTDLTAQCIESVLAERDPGLDRLVLINDASPEPGMADLLDLYAAQPNVFVLTNDDNLGFVASANRGIAFCALGDVVLLNADTRLFAGGLDLLWRAAHAAPEIATATALSNNATIFSYPVCNEPCAALPDIAWEDAAAAAAHNGTLVLDVPTGHGFCMLITRAALDRVGGFDPAFGRGYGEENDFCQRAADLGLRNVAACGVFVEHRESVSFGAEKAALLAANLRLLETRYPDYAAEVRHFIRADPLRAARWPIDAARLRAASASGQLFVLALGNWLDGGTARAARDIETARAAGGIATINLTVDPRGLMRLACATPLIAAAFAADETEALFALLDETAFDQVLIHQLLGYPLSFVGALATWCAGRPTTFFVHDYYAICPRVTLIDASFAFCAAAPVDVCTRCVAAGGAHEASRLTELDPAAHRTLFATLLSGTSVRAPSEAAAAWLRRALPEIACVSEPHPEPAAPARAAANPARDGRDIALLGALGPHKGSAMLHDVALRARLVAPDLRFHVIGYTDIDDRLRQLPNVAISGPYTNPDLPHLIASSGARYALFLHLWPETYSYTLSEAVQQGLIPVVPDIGAPAERVRAAGFGHVFGFPIVPADVVATLLGLIGGGIDPDPSGCGRDTFLAALGAG